MKKITLLSFAMLTIAMSSCSKDDTTNSNDATEQIVDDNAINAQEETILNADKVSDGIIIEGAAKIQGNPPTPNGKISFDLGYNKQSAFLQNGFDINFKAPDTYAGAYIQIKTEDGTIAQNYINVSDRALKNLKRKSSGLQRKSRKVDEFETGIDVDFTASVPPGKFCYLICIYDGEGNISLPQEVCVEIEAWGGNAALSGTWNNTKYEDATNGIIEEIGLVGVENCSDTSFFCRETQEIEAFENGNCYTRHSLTLVLNQNGTFRYDDLFDERELDYEASASTCTATFIEKKNALDYGKGNWAYNEDTKELTLVEFESGVDGEVEIYGEGESEIYAGTATISDGTMIFEFMGSFTIDDETTTYTTETFFVR